MGALVDFDGADWAQGALIAENEVNGAIFDETVGFVAVLAANFVAEKGGNLDVGDDIESLAKNVI